MTPSLSLNATQAGKSRLQPRSPRAGRVFLTLALLLAGLALLLAALVVGGRYWLGSDDFRNRAAAQASAALGVPVTLGAIGVDVWPLPAVAVSGIAIQTQSPLTLARLEVRPEWKSLLRGRLVASSVQVHQAVLAQSGVDALLASLQKKKQTNEQTRGLEEQNLPKTASKGATATPTGSLVTSDTPLDWAVHRVVLTGITWQSAKGDRIALNGDATLGADGLPDAAKITLTQTQLKALGNLQGTHASITRDTARDTARASADTATGTPTVNVARTWALVVEVGGAGATPPVASRGKLTGTVTLQMPLKPGDAITLAGQLETRGLDATLLGGATPPLSGQIEASTRLQARATAMGGLVDALQTQSKITVRNAVLRGLDLAKAVTTVGLSRGGETRLDVLAAEVRTQGKAVQVNNLAASSGGLSASGNVAIAPLGALSGRVNVAVGAGLVGSAAAGVMGIPLEVGGTLANPQVNLSRSALVGAAIGTVLLPGVGTGAGASLGDKLGDKLKGLFGR